jgi:transcriptional regulator with XRE-family HTH domain
MEKNLSVFQRVKILLIERKMTQTELAEAVGCSRFMMNEILRGKSYGLDEWHKIANVLGLTLEEINPNYKEMAERRYARKKHEPETNSNGAPQMP